MPKSNKYNKSYGLSNPLQDMFPEPIVAQRAPTTNDTGYRIGQTWVDQSSNQIYALATVASGSATWSLTGPGASDVDTLTGDSGGAISPSGGNINILGGDGLTVAGSGSTLTINRDAEGGYPITPYVVGSSGEAGYTTIQAAINAATSAGGTNVIWVQPGTYTEDLSITSSITFMSIDGVATIVGTHTPPASGSVNFDGFILQSATDILSSAAAGTTSLEMNNCFMVITNGYVFNLVNWTGDILMNNCGEASTNDGVIDNSSGSSNIKLINVEMGAGTGKTMLLNASGGYLRFDTCNVNCPVTMTGSGSVILQNGVKFAETVTIGGSLSGFAIETCWATGSSQALVYNSSGNMTISSCEINSTNTPAIGGTGSGTLTLTGISFPNDDTMAATLTLAGGTTTAGSFETLSQTAGLTISGDDIDADGSDANISITVSPKGTGDFIVDVGDIQDTAGDIIATRSSAGGDVTVEATNSDNTNSASRGGFEAAVGGTSAGDPYVNFLISGGQTFTMGIDNSSTNDDFVISDSAALGTTNRLVIDGSSGDTSVTGNLLLPTAATQLQVEGGAATDFIGTATLSSGTVTVANTNIAATDRIFIQRQDVNSSTAIGNLTYSISASTSFTITSVQDSSPGTTETNDVSIVMYFIVRQL